MNPTSSERFGDPITKDYCGSRRLLIQIAFFGVRFVLAVKIGRRLEITYVELNRAKGVKEGNPSSRN